MACTASVEPLRLGLPLECEVGRTCHVQNYFDHDPTAGVADHRCGPRTYDGHDGIDLRVHSVAAMEDGVAVLASASGTVKSRRDGEAERMLRDGERAPAGRECGNGVVIDHGHGWVTQVCHLARGSIAVAVGDRVEAGTPLGLVGLSGQTEFPHVHVAVRRDGVDVDPFAVGADGCGTGSSLWSEDVATALAYTESDVLDLGFAAAPVTPELAEEGRVVPPDAASPALLAWARSIGLREGDVQTLRLLAPDGSEVSSVTADPLPRPKARLVLYTGKRNTTGRFPSGTWTTRYTVVRDGVAVVERQATIEL